MIKDPLTNQEFEPKKISQRFANPQNRIKYHNIKAKNLRHYESGIDKPIKRNHRICMELLPPGKEKTEIIVHKEFLLGKGMVFGFNTSRMGHEGKDYAAVYNYIFITLDNNQIKIIKK